jgi:predicted RNase H-like HicB family nuclease
MKYPVVLYKSEEGFAVGCPGLPGCWSQGTTEQEALENIKVAIAEYLQVAREIAEEGEMREVEVALDHAETPRH